MVCMDQQDWARRLRQRTVRQLEQSERLVEASHHAVELSGELLLGLELASGSRAPSFGGTDDHVPHVPPADPVSLAHQDGELANRESRLIRAESLIARALRARTRAHTLTSVSRTLTGHSRS